MRFPAEWSRHSATWIAWPHHEPDWPGKIDAIPWVYAEIVRVLHRHERVEILCDDEVVREAAAKHLAAHGVTDNYRLHIVSNDRVWLRDSAPTAVVGRAVARITGFDRIEPLRPDNRERVVLEGGAIDTNGEGILLVTEECLLSDVQSRNPGLTRDGYEAVFKQHLGIRQTIWLGEGCVGDDTHGHVDDVARFVSPTTVVLAYEADPADDENHRRSKDNMERLELAGGAAGSLRIVHLPYPRPVIMNGERLPASYANFYIANGVVLVPTFNDRNDRVALSSLAELFPDRHVIGIHAVDLVWGFGTLHCLTQQEPAAT
jgi:agmatine deiminase